MHNIPELKPNPNLVKDGTDTVRVPAIDSSDLKIIGPTHLVIDSAMACSTGVESIGDIKTNL
jgi:hypothetical protein